MLFKSLHFGISVKVNTSTQHSSPCFAMSQTSINSISLKFVSAISLLISITCEKKNFQHLHLKFSVHTNECDVCHVISTRDSSDDVIL